MLSRGSKRLAPSPAVVSLATKKTAGSNFFPLFFEVFLVSTCSRVPSFMWYARWNATLATKWLLAIVRQQKLKICSRMWTVRLWTDQGSILVLCRCMTSCYRWPPFGHRLILIIKWEHYSCHIMPALQVCIALALTTVWDYYISMAGSADQVR